MIKAIFITIIIIHGLIHLMGFVKAIQLTEINQLTQTIPKPIGIIWLISTLLFIAVAAILIAIPAFVLSQLLIIMYWQDTKYGTLANVIILVGIVIGYGVWSFNRMVNDELKKFIANRYN